MFSRLADLLWPDVAYDGTPISEWDEYEFCPQHDITAYEIATILRNISPGPFSNGLAGPVRVRKGDGEWERLKLQGVRRHFKLVDPAKEEI